VPFTHGRTLESALRAGYRAPRHRGSGANPNRAAREGPSGRTTEGGTQMKGSQRCSVQTRAKSWCEIFRKNGPRGWLLQGYGDRATTSRWRHGEEMRLGRRQSDHGVPGAFAAADRRLPVRVRSPGAWRADDGCAAPGEAAGPGPAEGLPGETDGRNATVIPRWGSIA